MTMEATTPKGLILLGEYGSVAQGTATPDSDHDYMGVFIETAEQVIGMETASTKRVSDAAKGEKSAPGSSDTTYHTLRKFCSLAAGGNPTIGSILFLPKYAPLTETGQRLIDMRDAFISRKAGEAYLGYMTAQIKAFAGTGRKNRVELVEQYGYDIKFAYHAYRLGVQGLTMLDEGFVPIPLGGSQLDYANDLRAGTEPLTAVLEELDFLVESLKKSLDTTTLPEYADSGRINAFLVEAHQEHWQV